MTHKFEVYLKTMVAGKGYLKLGNIKLCQLLNRDDYHVAETGKLIWIELFYNLTRKWNTHRNGTHIGMFKNYNLTI